MLNNQLDMLLNIIHGIERTLEDRWQASQNAKAYINKYKANKKLNETLQELGDVELAYVIGLKEIKKRILAEINL